LYPGDVFGSIDGTVRRAAQALSLAILVFFVAPGRSHAQADAAVVVDREARREALELYRQSRERYDVGDYQGAIDLLDRAYEIFPEPVLLYNLARAHGNLGNFEAAVDLFERYLAEAPDADDRATIEERILHYRGALEEQRAQEAEQERERQEALDRARREAAAAESPSGPSVAPWILAGVGGTVLVAGAIFGGLSSSERSAAEEEGGFVAAEEASNRAVTYGWIANISFGVGALVALTGLAWGLVDLGLSADTESEDEPSVALDMEGLSISW